MSDYEAFQKVVGDEYFGMADDLRESWNWYAETQGRPDMKYAKVILEGDYQSARSNGHVMFMTIAQMKDNVHGLMQAIREVTGARYNADDSAKVEDLLPGEEDPMPATLPALGDQAED